MVTALNYILEANLVLLLMLAFYKLFLKGETDFGMLRGYLLLSILASLVFPFVDFESVDNHSPLAVGRVIPTYWLPEVAVNDGHVASAPQNASDFWNVAAIVYAVGLCVSCWIVIVQLQQLVRTIRNSGSYRREALRIAESTEDKPTFSFFNFIFIGKAHELSGEEKEQIIRHESVHASQWHSFDILLVNLLKVVFWFNPAINNYKKTFIQLHEFEADARAVENSDVNKYCSLLARVALQSADFKLANHFNNSLTVKRIEMMRTIKQNIKQWKLVAVVTIVPMVFLFVACQDQIENDLAEITRNSSHALMVPAKIQERYEFLKKENPDRNYALLELNETASQKLDELKDKYGLPGTIEVFPVKGETVLPSILGESSGTSLVTFEHKPQKRSEDNRTFAIIEFDERASKISESALQEDKVFTVVEKQPEFSGGYNAMMEYIKNNLRYPAQARQQGIEGTVFASFIVEKDGKISSVKIIRGISAECDNEVRRMVEQFPNWKPAKHQGEVVRVRFVLPIKFALDFESQEQSSK